MILKNMWMEKDMGIKVDKSIRIFCLFVVLISSCTTRNIDTQPLKCIDPEIGVDYEYKVENITAYYDSTIYITEQWIPQWDDETVQLYQDDLHFASDISAYNDEIWFRGETNIYRFNSDSEELSVYKLGEYGYPYEMLVSSEGNIWVKLKGSKSLIFLQYSKKDSKFEEIEINNSKGEKLFTNDPRAQNWYTMADAENNKFWFVYEKILWLVDPVQNTADAVEDSDLKIKTIAQGPIENSLWAIAENYLGDINVYIMYENKFISVNNVRINELLAGNEIKYDFPIASDQWGRLWISNVGWLEYLQEAERYDEGQILAKTYRLLDSPVFVEKSFVHSYTYGNVNDISVLSDGTIWYSSSVGIVRLDPKREEWCKVIKGGYPSVVETDNGNIWLVIDGQLYKYQP
jgi:hypothetical protein